MTDVRRINEGNHPTALTGGGHPEPVTKGWMTDTASTRGHQPEASMPEPTTGPSTPSGVGSANADSQPAPAPPVGD